jgi:hypothetical protein
MSDWSRRPRRRALVELGASAERMECEPTTSASGQSRSGARRVVACASWPATCAAILQHVRACSARRATSRVATIRIGTSPPSVMERSLGLREFSTNVKRDHCARSIERSGPRIAKSMHGCLFVAQTMRRMFRRSGDVELASRQIDDHRAAESSSPLVHERLKRILGGA